MHCLSTINRLNQSNGWKKERLTSTAPDVKLTVTHDPRKVLTQPQLNKKVQQELASKWSAKYKIERGA